MEFSRLPWSLLYSLTFCWTLYFCLSRSFRDHRKGKFEIVKGVLAALPPLSIIVLQLYLLLNPIEL